MKLCFQTFHFLHQLRHILFSNNFWSKSCEWTAWCFMCLICTWNKILDSKVQRKCEKVVQKLKKLFYFSSHYKFAIYICFIFTITSYLSCLKMNGKSNKERNYGAQNLYPLALHQHEKILFDPCSVLCAA